MVSLCSCVLLFGSLRNGSFIWFSLVSLQISVSSFRTVHSFDEIKHISYKVIALSAFVVHLKLITFCNRDSSSPVENAFIDICPNKGVKYEDCS